MIANHPNGASLGERGGTTSSLKEASDLIETHKDDLAAAVRADILDHLESRPEWHRDDLRVQLPAASKNVLGAVVNGLVRSGRIVETGERRASSEPAAHGRRSSVYRLSTSSGGHIPPGRKRDTVSTDAVSVSPNTSPAAKEQVRTPAELTGGRDAGGGRESNERGSNPPATGTLFDLPADRPGMADLDQRKAA